MLYFVYINVAVQVPQKSTGMTKSPVLLYNQENESVEKQKQKANPQVLMHSVFKKHNPNNKIITVKMLLQALTLVFFRMEGDKNLLILAYC